MKTILSVLLALGVLSGCQTRPQGALFDDLGGLSGIAGIVDAFIYELGGDARIAHHFQDTDPERFREKLIEQFCVESGGDCTYTGDSMKEVHAGLGISHADFNALVEDLIAAMEAENVPVAAQNRLLNRFAPMHAEIVEVP